MGEPSEKDVLRDFRRIPGVGPSIARDLWQLGYRSVDGLRGQNPERMYERFCEMQGMTIDRCLLYVFRGAVYFAENTKHDPELLKWWNWKDSKLVAVSAGRSGRASQYPSGLVRPRKTSGGAGS